MAFSLEPMDALKNYAVDIVVASYAKNTKGFTYLPIFKYQMLLVVARQNPLATKLFITLADL